MLILTDKSTHRDELSIKVRRLLELRSSLADLATFVIIQPGDTLAIVEKAAGYPLNSDHPPWEWVLDHGGVFEAPSITSDDGTATVLIAIDQPDIDPDLRALLRLHAESAEPS